MSETVKLIIEIPKAIYENLKSGKIYSSLCESPQGLVEGIRNGTPLDDVKAEIEEYRNLLIPPKTSLKNLLEVQSALNKVLEIIDNIGKENKE